MMLLGQVDVAAKLDEEGVRRAREAKHLFSLSFALTVAASGRVRLFRREAEIVRMQAEEAITLSEEHGFEAWLYRGQFNRGWALAELGQLHQGIAEMERGIAGSRRLGGSPFQQHAAALLAHAYARTGRIEEGLTLLNEALENSERTGEKVDQAEMLRLKAEVLLMRDRSSDGGSGALVSRCTRSRAPAGSQMVGVARDDRAWRDCSRSMAVATRRARCSAKSTAGSPRASTPPT